MSVLTAYAETCGCCREALAVPLGHKGLYNFACMGCVGRDIAIDPRIDSQRAKARHLKDTLMAKDFDAAMKAREQWIEHDRRAA